MITLTLKTKITNISITFNSIDEIVEIFGTKNPSQSQLKEFIKNG